MVLCVREGLLHDAKDGELHVGRRARRWVNAGLVVNVNADRCAPVTCMPVRQLGECGAESHVVQHRRTKADAHLAQVTGDFAEPLGLGGRLGLQVEPVDDRGELLQRDVV